MSYQAYLDGLPKKRMGAGCLFFSAVGDLLLLKPTYRDDWLIPGGVTEGNESPRQACSREVKEEIGIECVPQRLLCVDYINAIGGYSEAIQFVLLGGTISPGDIVIAEDEISDFRFAKFKDAMVLLGKHAERRIFWSLESTKSERTAYLENHEPV